MPLFYFLSIHPLKVKTAPIQKQPPHIAHDNIIPFHNNIAAAAVYWYETALNTPKNEYSGGFILPDCYDYVPLLQLCVCYDRLGDRQKAKEYTENISRFHSIIQLLEDQNSCCAKAWPARIVPAPA